jgi:hypothetical protein
MIMANIDCVVELRNPLEHRLPVVAVGQANPAVRLLLIPEVVREALELQPVELREVMAGDGTSRRVPYVGPIEVTVEDRHCFVGALVFGDQVILGSIPLSELELVVDPADHRLVANPARPTIRV